MNRMNSGAPPACTSPTVSGESGLARACARSRGFFNTLLGRDRQRLKVGAELGRRVELEADWLDPELAEKIADVAAELHVASEVADEA